METPFNIHVNQHLFTTLRLVEVLTSMVMMGVIMMMVTVMMMMMTMMMMMIMEARIEIMTK